MSTESISFAEIKQGLVGINRPFFSNWIWYAKNKGYLDPVVEGLIQTAQITDPIKSIGYLEKLITDDVLRNIKKVNYGDFQKKSTSRNIAKKLIEKITGRKPILSARDKTTRYGSYGHSMVAELFSGKLVSSDVFISGTPTTKQLDLFAIEKVSKKRKVFIKLVEKIERLYQQQVRLWENGHTPNQTSEYRELLSYVRLVYGEHLNKVHGGDTFYDGEDQYFSFLTVMTWVQVLLYYKDIGNYPLFSEVPVLKNSEDVGVGRLDILKVVTIGGVLPDMKQIVKVRKLLTKRYSFASGGHIVRALINQFGDNLHLKVIDWKFAVGDGINGMKKKVNIIYKTDVESKPLKKHENQVKRYLSLLVVSHSLAAGYSKLHETEKLWETGRLRLSGELVYFLPDSSPIVYEVQLTAQEVRSVFQDQIVTNFGSAKVQSSLRIATNLAMGYVLNLLNNEVIKERVPEPNHLKFDFPEETVILNRNQPTISEIIMDHYVPIFKDPETKFFEVVGHKGVHGTEEALEVHLDTVLKAAARSTIDLIRTATGIKFCCPVHGENTPSCHIAYDIGRFTCFGCNIRGNINVASIPNDIQIGTMKMVRWELEKLIIPPRHREIMLCAQEILHRCFWGSKGEMYLSFERRLNPSYSYTLMDAGFADERLLVGLLAEGFSFEDLVLYGFVDFASGVSSLTRTVKTLEAAGHSVESQKRLIDKKTNKWGLPYSVLEDKVTYPLEIHKTINSFYGRSVLPGCPKHLRHRKLRAKETGMRHGGVNISWAALSHAKYIMIVEAPINMATLFQITTDLKALTAVVGVNNPLLLEFLASYKGDIILGLDYDKKKWNEKLKKDVGETGQKNTVLFRDKLINDYGFAGNVYDFTGGFVKNNPGVNYNDPNQYWMEHRKKISIFDNIQEIPEVFVSAEDK